MSEQQRITAEILIETNESLVSLRRYVVTAVKQSCRNVRGGAVVVALYDEDDNFLGLDVAGTPSEEMREQMNELLGTEGMAPPAPPVSPR